VNPTLRRWAPPLLWAAGIFALSSRSRLPRAPWLLGWDKLQHGFAYALGGWLLARALRGSPRAATWALALGSLYGVSDELHQAWVPGRNSDLHDWLADTVGVLAGIALFHLTLQLHARRRSHVPEPAQPTAT
jgi:VanZ family protein